ncbi:MAG: 3-isopropylmalate dehydrogenase [Gemmatimonadetes bacterium]|nr:3-isopropylmalate dehydrogenase [Gemmatimonadota bacterium]
MRASIALLPGDGIGPEVTDAAAAALDAVSARYGHRFTLTRSPFGAAALRAGDPPLPQATLQTCLAADAVLLGAVGDPAFSEGPGERRPEAGLLQLRRELGVYANLRPARVWPGLEHAVPLRPERVRGLDLLIVRELTGGIYFGEPRGRNHDRSEAFDTMRYAAHEVERIATVAFESARKRRKLVTSVDKANVLECSRLWREVVTEVADRYPDVRLEHQLVDSCAMRLVSDPGSFDVLLTGNLFGDILSDEAGAVVGSLGLLPSASIGGRGGLFEPVHGSAPDIAGRDAANPVGAIASAAMLLRHALGASREADAIESAIGAALDDGCRTADLAPPGAPAMGCTAMTKAIVGRIGDLP